MFTRCPDCLATQAITPEALRDGRGMTRCGQCGVMFDALAMLAETESQALAEPAPTVEPWRAAKPVQQSRLWRLGVVIGAALLCAQLAYFEGGRAPQDPRLRPVLEKLCGVLRCALPAYRNPAELNVLHNVFSPLPNGHYLFKLVLHNESAFAMAYPKVGLTLLTFDGQAFAQRSFQPREYLAEPARLAAHASAEISLEIAAPKAKVGGFHFDLSY